MERVLDVRGDRFAGPRAQLQGRDGQEGGVGGIAGARGVDGGEDGGVFFVVVGREAEGSVRMGLRG